MSVGEPGRSEKLELTKARLELDLAKIMKDDNDIDANIKIEGVDDYKPQKHQVMRFTRAQLVSKTLLPERG